MKQNKKSSAYQKLKAENEKLKSDLSILACHPDSEKGISIKTEWKMKANIETAVWAGGTDKVTFGGIRQFANIETSKDVFSQ
jgi:hypothetical protein